MSTAALSPGQLPLAPLGAGDLIDRAVRLYRRHLFVLIRTAAPPMIIAAAGWIVFSLSIQRVFITQDTDELFIYILLSILSFSAMMGGYLFTLVVMGGATRTLVAHLLRNEPVTARATYAAVRARFWGLLGASFIVLIWIAISLSAVWVVWYVLLLMMMMAVFLSSVVSTWLAIIVGIIGGVLATGIGLWLFFFIVGRVAYVPQVMLVEGKGVFEAFSRSFSLARGNVRRLMAMTLFTTFATYSALMILLLPLGWYGYLSGVDPLNSTQWPAWYSIAYSVLGPLSSILLTPVWMLGLSLLYVDERVRHEGYDIELMAARQLGELPDVNVSSPLGTALSSISGKLPPPTAVTHLALAAVLLLVPAVTKADTISDADYQNKLQQAVSALESMQAIEEAETPYYNQNEFAGTLAKVREALPEQQQVQAGNEVCNVDNTWVHAALKDLEAASPEDRADKLTHLVERLKAIEERVAYERRAAMAADSKANSKEKLEGILARPEYTTQPKGTNALTRLLQDFIRWLQQFLPEPVQVKPGRSSWLTGVAQVAVILVALLIVLYVARILSRRFRRTRKKRAPKKRGARIVLGEQLKPEDTATDLLSEAEALARRGELRAAIRKAYIALLVELGDRKVITLEQHKTNRDYLNAVRSSPVLHSTMRGLTDSFELHWYGFAEATENDWNNFRSRYKQALQTQN
ncbi:MAG: DUF4129 domain-containing protein [Acidobacteria bacterium]|nr:DUF4129 domain-containing protein [Acidobacteriota bacterium]MCA1627814.1 DUF4129 domain-containing protein [Acidobacteriota bacterium]